jgi:hypothetical protein
MATDTLYYGGVIPGSFIATYYDVINEWFNVNLDNQLARRACAVTKVAETTEEYEITKIDFSGDDVVPKNKKSPGVEVSLGGASAMASIFRWPDFFTLNEADLAKDPRLQGQYVEACLAKIFRGEDKVFYAGRAVNNITGFATAAAANSNGTITAAASSGVHTGNVGAWLTADTNRDIYQDVLNARGKLDSKFRGNLTNLYLVGNANSMDALWQKDPYNDNSTPVYQSVAPLLGRSPTAPIGDWAIINDQIAAGYVYLITKDKQAAEIVQSKGITIDDNYPRKPIGNFEVHIYEDVGMIFKNNNAFVQLEIT